MRPAHGKAWSTESSDEQSSSFEHLESKRGSKRLPGAMPMMPMTAHVDDRTRRTIHK